MKQYTADKHAQYTLQIATPIVTAVLIGLIWYFLAVLPHWLLWTLTAVLAAAAILLSTLLLPMWFCTVTYCVSATHITRKCGIFFIQEQVMRTLEVPVAGNPADIPQEPQFDAFESAVQPPAGTGSNAEDPPERSSP